MRRKAAAWAATAILVVAAGCAPPGGNGTDQDISIRQGSTEIPNGSGVYRFEEGVIIDGEGGQTSSGAAFAVVNTGAKDLRITSASLGGGVTGDFDLDSSMLAATIPPYSSSTFLLRFDPLLAMGTAGAMVTIQSNDPDEGTYTFTVKGIGVRKLTASDGAAAFGCSVAFSGDTAVVGASAGNAAYVFYRNPPGGETWQEVKKLTGSGSFGYSVAISGDVVVVGAPDADTQAGAAFVYSRNSGGTDNWGLVKECIANDRDGWNDAFGDALSLSGDTLIIGARRDTDGSGGAHGSAYVCYRNQGGADTWGVVKKIRPADNAHDDYFATSVSLDGDTLAAGAPGRGGSVGAVYFFSRNSGGTDNWGEVRQFWYTGGSSMPPQFGRSVAIVGDTLAIGAPLESFGTGWQGCVYVYYRNQGGTDNWGAVRQLVDPEGVGGDYLGWRIALANDTLVAGAYGDTYASSFAWGSICAFGRNQGGMDTWGRAVKLLPADGGASSCFGTDVAFDGTTVLVGASNAVYALKF